MANDCATCEERNPQPRNYSKAAPTVNENCIGCDPADFIDTGGGAGKTTELIAGDQIGIQDISDALTDRFIVSFVPFVDLTVSLNLTALASGEIKTNLVLFGTVITQVDLTWTYNKAVVSQSLSNNGDITNPSIEVGDRDATYPSQGITNDVRFTISGDDGEGQPGSTASASQDILFGNYRVWGKGPRYDNGTTPLATLQSFIEGLIAINGTKEITTTRVKSGLVGEGGTLEFFYYAYPARFGLATFLQNGIPGGYKRLGNFGGTIQVATFDSIDGGESDINISNGLDSEPFYVYQSGADNINGAVFDVT